MGRDAAKWGLAAQQTPQQAGDSIHLKRCSTAGLRQANGRPRRWPSRAGALPSSPQAGTGWLLGRQSTAGQRQAKHS